MYSSTADVSDSLQNLILQHSSIDTFLKHYLDRNINVDVQNIYRGREPQKALMRFACSMSRSIDPRRPWKLTPQQSRSINDYQCIVKLQKRVDSLYGAPKASLRRKKYQEALRRLRNEKQRQRGLLKRDIVALYRKEQPVIDSERQLLGKVVDEEVRSALERSDYMTPEQLVLIDAVLTLPETSPEKEYQRRIAAINGVAAYCGVEEGTSCHHGRPGRPVGGDVSKVTNTDAIALRQAIISIRTDKRPRICFLCLGNSNLPTHERVFSFKDPGCLSKHFRRKHVQKMEKEQRVKCKICCVTLNHRMHLQHHAEKFHGTVSRVCI
jgi:hypothetical protein